MIWFHHQVWILLRLDTFKDDIFARGFYMLKPRCEQKLFFFLHVFIWSFDLGKVMMKHDRNIWGDFTTNLMTDPRLNLKTVKKCTLAFGLLKKTPIQARSFFFIKPLSPMSVFFFANVGPRHPGNIPRVVFKPWSELNRFETSGEVRRHVDPPHFDDLLMETFMILNSNYWLDGVIHFFLRPDCLQTYTYKDIAKWLKDGFFSRFLQHLKKYSEISGREPPTSANSTLCWWNNIYQGSLFNSFQDKWDAPLKCSHYTLPENKIAPETPGLEDEFPFKKS